MISRVTMRKSGLAQYLEDGKRADSELSRDQKDNAIPLYGSLKLLKKAEDYCNEKKNWSANYEHITISFSEEDEKILNSTTDQEQSEVLQDIAVTMIKHRTSGYDLQNEVIAYAEMHDPKVKEEVNARSGEVQKRRKHIHIGISYLNPLSETKLQTTFYNNSYISDTVDKYIAKKHGLTYAEAKAPSDNGIDKPSQMTINRNIIKDATKDFTTKEELYNYLDTNGIEYDFTNKKSDTKQSNIYVYNDKGGKIHLRGKDFPNIEIMHNPTLNDTTKQSYIKELKTKSLQELGDILETYYKTNRIPLIDKKRSKESTKLLNDIYKKSDNNTENDKVNSFTSLQAKIFYKHYRHLVTTNLKGYYVDTKADDKVKFSNKAKEIEVVDHGNKITANTSTKNLEEKVKLMVDIAIAKEWNLSALSVTGGDAFKKEAYRQIAQQIREKKEQESKQTLSLQTTAVVKGIERPKTVTQHLAKVNKERKEAEAMPLAELKQKLSAQTVLDHAVKKYKLDLSQYEITADNKINNLGNRAKPKNVIDFLQKEVNLTSKEAIRECQELYSDQPMPVKAEELPTPVVQVSEPIKLKPKQRITDAERNIYKHINQESGEQRRTRNGVRKLSNIHLLSDKKSTARVLLSSDERNNIRTKTSTDTGVQSARVRATQTPIKSRADGGLEMPLFISVTDDKSVVKKPSGKLQMTALNGWRVQEVSNYNDLSLLMKQYSYAPSRFDKKYRISDNANTFNNLLIYDIDNDPNDKQITLKEAKALLSSKGISAMLMPSKSHQKEKFTDSGKSKGVKDRYRIVIPTKTAIRNNTDKDTYREFQRLVVETLGLTGAVDTNALTDMARFYQQSLPDAVRTIVDKDANGNKITNIFDAQGYEDKAIENVTQTRAEKEAQRVKMEEIRVNLKKYRSVTLSSSNNLTYVDAEEIMDVPINALIIKFESGEEKEEGSYKYIKTDATKYSIIDDKLAHDFKNDITYNSLTYLQMQFETNNLNSIARELEKQTGESYIRCNMGAVKTAVVDALKEATNDKTFEGHIKEYFNVKFVKLEKDSIKIADQEIKLSIIDTDKGKIIDSLKSNRAIETQKKAEAMKAKEVKNTLDLKHKKELKQQGQSQGRGGMSR